MEFDERQLRAFLAVAETGSLGRASRIVNLTQPSLSRQIQQMEDRLGHRLFDRQTRGMALTAAGELLVPHVRHLVFEMQTTRDELAALRGLRRGTVRVGAVAAVLRTLVAETAARLLASSPNLAVELLEGVEGELVEALVTRRVDLVVASPSLTHPEISQIGICSYRDRFAVFCGASHPLPRNPDLEDVLAEEWVMPGAAFTPRTTFEGLIDALGLARPRVAVETTSLETMIALTAHSRLLAWLPEPLVAAHVASGAVRQVSVPELAMERGFVLHRRRSGLLPDAAKEFVEHFPLLSGEALA